MKIAVLTSGGVDSSVALRLLKDQGYDLTAFYLKIWLEDELQFLGDCPWEDDLQYVRKICAEIDVPLEVVPMQKQYFDHVVSYTINEVKQGRTPNPDIFCNKLIKFGLFFDHIGPEFEKIATGHYAQVTKKDGHFLLKKAPDAIKDQTYFLARLSQKQLSRCLFPLGDLTKEEVRDLAEKYDLPNKNRKDSQGICFLGKFKFRDFLNTYLGEEPGPLLEYETGQELGQHRGFWYYTIGQRKDIRLPDGPWYVVKKEPQKNIVYVSKHYHDKDKSRNQFYVTDFNWFSDSAPKEDQISLKIRHGAEQYQAQIKYLSSDLAQITLDQDDQGIAAGQFAVFYDQDLCLGSAMITTNPNPQN